MCHCHRHLSASCRVWGDSGDGGHMLIIWSMKTHWERDSVLKSNCLNELDIFIAKIHHNTL